MKHDPRLAGLPGAEWIAAGLEDYQAGRRTAAAYLVAMASARIARAGLLPAHAEPWPEPELGLYRLLRDQPGDAYSRYNALRRELDSFLAALTRR